MTERDHDDLDAQLDAAEGYARWYAYDDGPSRFAAQYDPRQLAADLLARAGGMSRMDYTADAND